MGKPRLLVLASTYPARPGDGTPSFVRDLALGMAEAFDIEVLVPAVPGGARHESDGALTVARFRYFWKRWEDLADGAILENVRARRSRLLQVPFLLVAEYVAVRRAVRRRRPDAIHAHWIIPQGLVARLATRGIPTVVTTLGGDLYALRSGAARRLKAGVVRHASAVTVMNDEMRAMVEALGANPAALSVMPMGFDPSSLATGMPRPPRDTVSVLFVGRLVEKKGLAVLLAALRERPPAASWRLVVVGDGPLRADLEMVAASMPVSFVGQLGRTDLSNAYIDADIAIFPSVRAATGDQDGLPVALLEAMGSGCAVIASDLPGLTEAVERGRSGVLVPPGDSDALADALGLLADDPDRRRRLGERAAARARDFDVSTVARGYRDLLLRVLSDTTPRR
ncbi:MAG TPA: glycosyltransferase family 4 protein [Demequinaceae bacterium]